MLVQVSGPPHCGWGVEWSASWIWQSETPVECAVFSPREQEQLYEYKIQLEWANAASFCSASSSTHQLLHSSEELRNEGETFLLACDFPELLCWKRWARISREKHCLQPDIVPDAAWSACGHLR